MSTKKTPALERVHKLPEAPVYQITKEAWTKPGARVGMISRIDWGSKGARVAIIQRIFEICATEGCHYNGLNGGLVDKQNVKERIDEETKKVRNRAKRNGDKLSFAAIKKMATDNVISKIARELAVIIPLIKKPSEVNHGGLPYARLYIFPSLVIDGPYGTRIAMELQDLRPDIRVFKTGCDYTRLKGIGESAEEKKEGQLIGWVNPCKSRLPGQYASTGPDKEIDEQENAAERLPKHWIFGGTGSSTSKPGGGEKRIARLSLPIAHIPTPGRPGEPSLALNQIGVRILEAYPDDGFPVIRTWSLRDLAKDERLSVFCAKTGAKKIHHQIVEAIARDRRGLTIGELSDVLNLPRESLEKEIQFLVESRASKRTTWSGLYRDESGRFNFHRDWLQERLRYPWPYNEGYTELRRLVFGCLHAGYTTTDYEYVRYRLPKIMIEHNINVLELVGDIVAGLKHHLVHRGQVIGNLTYTEQEIFAGELVGTGIYDVFVHRFNELSERNKKAAKPLTNEDLVMASLILFLYIIGNHDFWQKELGIIPGATFKEALTSLLVKHIGAFLKEKKFAVENLDAIVRSKVVELPEYRAVYKFPGDVSTALLHPSMSRTKTVSIRPEEALNFSSQTLVDIANFHTTIEVEKWDPELGQRVAAQAGAMVVFTDFENGKLKKVDFGPLYVGVRAKSGRIFMTEHRFFNKPILQKPISKNTDITELKKKLGLKDSPMRIPE